MQAKRTGAQQPPDDTTLLMKQMIVPRLEDLPYATSPPIQFVYESIAPLAAGSYVWADRPSILVPDRPLMDNAVYFFRSITLAADIAELDFEGNVSSVPNFRAYLTADGKAVLFREPILMNMFYQQFDYRLVWTRAKGSNQLLASFTGSLLQGAGLIGKASITLMAIISAQEVTDEAFNELLIGRPYPKKRGGVNE